MSAAEVIADEIAGFQPERDDGQDGQVNLAHATAILDALKAAGHAVVELPKPMDHRDGVAEKLHPHPMWQAGDSWTCLLDAETIEFESDAQSAYGTVDPACARTLAAALLAAAEVDA